MSLPALPDHFLVHLLLCCKLPSGMLDLLQALAKRSRCEVKAKEEEGGGRKEREWIEYRDVETNMECKREGGGGGGERGQKEEQEQEEE